MRTYTWQILILCMPTFYHQPSFCLQNWVGNAQISPQMNPKFWNFPITSRGSAESYLYSVITAISAWFLERKNRALW